MFELVTSRDIDLISNLLKSEFCVNSRKWSNGLGSVIDVFNLDKISIVKRNGLVCIYVYNDDNLSYKIPYYTTEEIGDLDVFKDKSALKGNDVKDYYDRLLNNKHVVAYNLNYIQLFIGLLGLKPMFGDDDVWNLSMARYSKDSWIATVKDSLSSSYKQRIQIVRNEDYLYMYSSIGELDWVPTAYTTIHTGCFDLMNARDIVSIDESNSYWFNIMCG